MVLDPDFPNGAFKREGYSHALSHIFKQREYEADDVRKIRSSFYMSDFHSQDSAQCYTLSWVSAHKKKDGNFLVSVNSIDVEDDKILDVNTHRFIENTPHTYCSQDRVLEEIKRFVNILEKKAAVEAPHLSPPPTYINDYIHISVAQEIFDHPCKKNEIESHVHRIENQKPQKIEHLRH